MRLVHPRSLAAAASFVALLAAGLGAPAHAAFDPCKLVTAAEATKALGSSAQPGIHESDTDGPSCRIYNADKSRNIVIGTGSLKDMNEMASSMKAMPASERAKIPNLRGIGDAAVAFGSLLYVRKGANVATVQLYLREAETTLSPQALALGRAVARRL